MECRHSAESFKYTFPCTPHHQPYEVTPGPILQKRKTETQQVAELGFEAIAIYEVTCTSLVCCHGGQGTRPLTEQVFGRACVKMSGNVRKRCIGNGY